jgi:hypothetical protein
MWICIGGIFNVNVNRETNMFGYICSQALYIDRVQDWWAYLRTHLYIPDFNEQGMRVPWEKWLISSLEQGKSQCA